MLFDKYYTACAGKRQMSRHLPLILRHIDMPRERITIVTGDNRGRQEAAHYGINFVINPLRKDNYRKILDPLLRREPRPCFQTTPTADAHNQ